ncbi:MAG: ATP-binding protein [Gammaproteobacteria bacterium]|nr:ATP-binding protein [Gammaproteobacteria bacterium]
MALPSGTPALEYAVFLERTKLIYANVPATILAIVLVSPCLIYVNWQLIDQTMMISWLILMNLTMLYRYIIYTLFNKKADSDIDPSLWYRLFLIGTVLTAVCWSVTGSVLFLSDSIQQQLFTATMLAGISAGALATQAAFFSIFLLYTVINMTPMMLTLLSFGSGIHYATALLIFFFMVFIITASSRMSKIIKNSISLQFQHDSVLKDIAEQKQQTDNLNINLRQQISEREFAEQHLEKSMSQLKATLESATDSILVIDNDEKITNYNQNFIDLFDIPSGLIRSRDYSAVQSFINNQLITESTRLHPSHSDEFVLLKLNDNRLVEVFSRPQKIGELTIGLVYSFRDATMRINSESSLQEAKTKAEIANKEKSDFLSRVSHELRTPLNAILGFAHLLKENNHDHLDTEEKNYISHICLAGDHLLSLIDDLLDISRIESGKLNVNLSSIPCENIINESVSLVQPIAEINQVTILLASEFSEAPYVYADHTRCKQALVNLLSNAIKYNHKGGTVSLTLRPKDSEVRFEVNDTGIGIEEAHLNTIFQPFTRLKQVESTKGTGIGLTITKRLLSVMNGTIGVNSIHGKGSTFWFQLPSALAQDSAETTQPIVRQFTENTIETMHTILYIEDEPLNQALVKSIIKQIPNTRLITALSGEAGVELALKEQPDLILMDLNLPGISGYEAMNILKNEKSFSKTPVFAVSANAMPDEIRKGKDAGFIDYLIKPINIDNTRTLLVNTLGMIDNHLI